MKSKLERRTPYAEKPTPAHTGETVEQFLKRGGKIKKLEPAVADGAVAFTTKWPGGRP